MAALLEYYLDWEKNRRSSQEPLLKDSSKPKPPKTLQKLATKYILWLAPRQPETQGLDMRSWYAMMSTSQQPLGEKEFITIISQACSSFALNTKTSEIGWNAGESTIFLLLKFKGTPKPYLRQRSQC